MAHKMLSVASVLFWFTDYTISVFIMMQTTKEVPLLMLFKIVKVLV